MPLCLAAAAGLGADRALTHFYCNCAPPLSTTRTRRFRQTLFDSGRSLCQEEAEEEGGKEGGRVGGQEADAGALDNGGDE
jgi:hypothetical protein